MKELIVKNIHIIIILYAGFNLFELFTEKDEELTSLVGRTPSIRAKIQQSKTKLNQIEEFKKNLTSTKERVEEVVKQIEKVQKQLPSDVSDTQVQSTLSRLGEKVKIRDIKQLPKDEKNNGFYFSKLYQFAGTGTFLQALIFFENLEKEERILNVKSFKIEPTNQKSRSRFQVTNFETDIESFRYNTNHKEKDVLKEIDS